MSLLGEEKNLEGEKVSALDVFLASKKTLGGTLNPSGTSVPNSPTDVYTHPPNTPLTIDTNLSKNPSGTSAPNSPVSSSSVNPPPSLGGSAFTSSLVENSERIARNSGSDSGYGDNRGNNTPSDLYGRTGDRGLIGALIVGMEIIDGKVVSGDTNFYDTIMHSVKVKRVRINSVNNESLINKNQRTIDNLRNALISNYISDLPLAAVGGRELNPPDGSRDAFVGEGRKYIGIYTSTELDPNGNHVCVFITPDDNSYINNVLQGID